MLVEGLRRPGAFEGVINLVGRQQEVSRWRLPRVTSWFGRFFRAQRRKTVGSSIENYKGYRGWSAGWQRDFIIKPHPRR